MKSVTTTLHFAMKDEDIFETKQTTTDVTATLRVADGALIVVDTIDGMSVQSEIGLRRALVERVKPVFIINNIDRALENKLDKEALYATLTRTIENINEIILTYNDKALGDLRVSPEKGTIAFGSGRHGWAFNLSHFAARYSKRFGVSEEKMMSKLWGDNFYNPATKQWTTESAVVDQKPLERGFNLFVLDPIINLFDAIVNLKKDLILTMLESLSVPLNAEENDLEGLALLKVVMRKFLPAADALLEIICTHLPSPPMAQSYRMELLYDGPHYDDCAVAVKNCDSGGPLMLYVAKMVPTSNNGRFYAFGRVFSGTVRAGQQVRILGPAYVPGKKEDLYVKKIRQTVLMLGENVFAIEDCPAGNIVGLVGVDPFLLKGGTITTSETAHNLKAIKLSIAPVAQIAVDVRNAKDLPKLVEGLKLLSKSDPCAMCYVEDSGEHIVAGAGELHLEDCLKDLEETHARIPISKGDPVVQFRETVLAESSRICLAKSANKHSRIFMKASPMCEDLAGAIEAGKVGANDDRKIRAKTLADDYGWEPTDARKIWCFGPDSAGANVLVDVTKGVQYLHEIQQSCVTGFQWATREGVLCSEKMRAVRFNILDAVLFSDAIHRGGGQVVPACRRAVYASFLSAEPALQEPVYLVEILCPDGVVDNVYGVLGRRRGTVLGANPRAGGSLLAIRANLPVAESFGFAADLRAATGGQALSQEVFDRWQVMPGDVLQPGSKLQELVLGVRGRKGLKLEMPKLDDFCDKL
ncbi:Elongation factor 2 [Cladochytrium tenue]|nr:Elongation factor 2 [Cladochytrium tenue]